MLGVTYKDDAGASRDFMRRFKLTYPSLRDDKLELAPKFGTNRLPETFVLDARGRVVALSRGEVDKAFLQAAIHRAEAS
ncbi:MAG: cytochrome c biosis protein CcmG, thiol:disulfide interchange protein DsbE [Solirubrobacteraceae bacterium]|nr:cytochrome c biosis protein CcmG, thiol:disulfide interchange protein DsbE [Solirubrobacteraceae bacterium]